MPTHSCCCPARPQIQREIKAKEAFEGLLLDVGFYRTLEGCQLSLALNSKPYKP